MAVKVALVYPYFHPSNDNSIFRFPPLGLGYIAAALQKRGFEVELVDCTFMGFGEAVERVKRAKPQIVGFYSMFSMKKTTLELASAIKSQCDDDCVFVVGGPLPSWSTDGFLDVFDAVAVGEGEETITELADCVARELDWRHVKGLVLRNGGREVTRGQEPFIQDLDSLAFPTRHLFDNEAYKRYYLDHFGYSTSSMITSRGCPFSCDSAADQFSEQT